MSELGEGVSVPKPVAEIKEKGDLTVSVRDICDGARIGDAKVTVNGKTKDSDEYGVAEFSGLPIGATDVKVKVHLKDVDYSTFIIHYPKVLSSHSAKSAGSDVVEIKAGSKNRLRVELEIFKIVGKIVFFRRHIDRKSTDKYGHWWTVVDDSTSYGWWPKYHVGSSANSSADPPEPPKPLVPDAGKIQQIQYRFDMSVYKANLKIYKMKESSVGQTFRGVEGELNGQTSFGGTPTRDPHHIGSDPGDEQFQPVRHDCFDLAAIKNCIEKFANSYAGGWSWRLEGGNHCHTFQKKIMSHCELTKVKVLK